MLMIEKTFFKTTSIIMEDERIEFREIWFNPGVYLRV